jgi:hypothetical protein
LKLTVNGTDKAFPSTVDVAGLPALDIKSPLGTAIGTHTIAVKNPGPLAPKNPAPADQSALDDDKLADILLYLEVAISKYRHP